jgi:hypothetical protein
MAFQSRTLRPWKAIVQIDLLPFDAISPYGHGSQTDLLAAYLKTHFETEEPMITRSFIIGLLMFSLAPTAAHGLQTTTTASESATAAAADDKPATVKLEGDDNKMNVMLNDKLFTTFDFKTYDKPILYPIYAPGQIAMTRDWPMKEDSVGESRDHPHHKSMWISHEISGVDFWAEQGGTVKTMSMETKFAGKPDNVFRATSVWVKKTDGKTLMTDQTTYWFGGDKTSRWINCMVNYRATHGDFQFDDTKEGLFAIRTHPDLRLTAKPKAGVTEVFGKAINSEGVTGKDVWGKQAKWLLYYGPIDGKPVSIAMYDHPTNLRHPTTWHARDYGLVTANPFGMHHFLGKEKGSGAFQVKDGDSLQLRYRIEFFNGIATPETIEEKYQAFAKETLPNLVYKKR